MKQNIDSTRFTSDDETTLSLVRVDQQFVCFFLEDEYRAVKVYGETRIQAGTYPILLRTEGRLHEKYSERFADIHRGMLHLQAVPEFTWIQIHCGNDDDHTDGCPLTGMQAVAGPDEMRVLASSVAYRKLYSLVVDAAAARELTITITDDDRRPHP